MLEIYSLSEGNHSCGHPDYIWQFELKKGVYLFLCETCCKHIATTYLFNKLEQAAKKGIESALKEKMQVSLRRS